MKNNDIYFIKNFIKIFKKNIYYVLGRKETGLFPRVHMFFEDPNRRLGSREQPMYTRNQSGFSPDT